MPRFPLVRTLHWALLLNVMGVGCAFAAAPLTVGDTTACDFNDLQTAIDHPNAITTEIHVVVGYKGKPIHFANGYFRIYGGYPDCNPDSTPIAFNGNLDNLSTLDGSLAPGQPVISVMHTSALDLRNFQVTNGFNSGRDGGGIRYETFDGDGLGHLELHAVNVNKSRADRGGGIFFRGHAAADELILLDDSYIEYNFANNDGGGIRLEGNTVLTAVSPQTTISNNEADRNNDKAGLGGGLQVLDHSKAYIGSPGYNGRAVIEFNHARFGGGIAMGGPVAVQLYMVQAGSPARVENNDALINGGGVYLKPNEDFDPSVPKLCGFNYGINHNAAKNGAAVYGERVLDDIVTQSYIGPDVELLNSNTCDAPVSAIACIPGTACNSMNDNTADANSGAIVSMDGEGEFDAELIELRGNKANHIFMLSYTGGDARLSLTNCLIAENTVGAEVILAGGTTTTVDGCTIANNGAFTDILFSLGTFYLNHSIVWQPGLRTINHPTIYTTDFTDSIVSDADTLDAGITVSNVQGSDPAFVHPAGGNYQLRNTSPAIDYTNSCDPHTSEAVDLVFHYRKILLNGNTPCDIGAYERQTLPFSTFPFDETFDEADPYALDLPVGWVNQSSGAGGGWFIAKDALLGGSFTAHAIDPGTLDAVPNGTAQSDSSLTTPPFRVDPSTQLTFDQRFDFEGNYDGAILEIAIGDSAVFTEITAAGGSFEAGGYNSVLWHGATPNPIEQGCIDHQVAICSAWTGGSGGVSHAIVNLPLAAAGQMVRLRWRVGSDGNGPQGNEGYYLDNVHVSEHIFKNGFGPPPTNS